MRRFHIGSPEWAPPRVPLQLPLGYGSLGWLVYLLQRQKIDLLTIDLAPIAQACYDYWREVGDLDEASDSVAVLAHLTERKAERLLTPPAEPPLEEEEWLEPAHLPESFLPILETLREREDARLQIFFRSTPLDPDTLDIPLPEGAELPDALWLAFQRLLQRALPVPDAIPERRYFSIHARMITLRQTLQEAQAPIAFDTIAHTAEDIYDLLVCFLAMLELWRLGQIEVSVDAQFGIWLSLVETDLSS